jgi:hypothetical protein
MITGMAAKVMKNARDVPKIILSMYPFLGPEIDFYWRQGNLFKEFTPLIIRFSVGKFIA